MTREDILAAILILSQSRGFYGKLYQFLTRGDEESEGALQALVDENFGSITEMCLYIEG